MNLTQPQHAVIIPKASLLEKDKWGNWVIYKEYNAAMLAEAVCNMPALPMCDCSSITAFGSA